MQPYGDEKEPSKVRSPGKEHGDGCSNLLYVAVLPVPAGPVEGKENKPPP